MSTQSASVRTYGGWRRTRGIGLGGLDSRSTVVVVGSLAVVTVLVATAGVGAALVAAVPAALAGALCIWRRDGVALLDYTTAAARFRVARSRGETSYRGHAVLPWPHAGALPGVLASCELLDVEVPGQERAGLVWDRRTGLMSGTVLLSTGGTLLSDAGTADAYVASWSATLAAFAEVPAIRWAAVTVDITPDGGHSLRQDVAARMDPTAPPLAQHILTELVAGAPARSARVSTRMTLTVDPTLTGDRIEEVADGSAATVRVLRGLDLAACGAEVVRMATAADLARMVRTAYDPHLRSVSAQDWAAGWDAQGEPAGWAMAGPSGAEEEVDCYRHEDVVSVSWSLLEAPRQRVAHNVLLRLLSPGRFPRRVTVLYRVLGREEAGALLEREQTASDARTAYRAKTRRDESARERADRALAHGNADEEAAGAGLVQFSLFVTTTVADPRDLAAARAEVENAAGASRITLRAARFSQASAFAVGLPTGVYPPAYHGRRR
ncbi:MAG: SCO6880 family protein [Sporichthyaceae bacterium]